VGQCEIATWPAQRHSASVASIFGVWSRIVPIEFSS
jgi:hypothetical protein